MGHGNTDTIDATKVLMLTADAEFSQMAAATFGSSGRIELRQIAGPLAERDGSLDLSGATVAVLDVGAASEEDLGALERLMARHADGPPVVVVTESFDEAVARRLLRMRAGDFLMKPVSPIELVRACARVATTKSGGATAESQIYTFLPAVGGAGVTTLAVQTAMLLLNSGGPRTRPSTCLVDLDLQHGAIADYLDLEPRLNLDEVEPRPERLDRQLLEIMLAHHSSGLAVVAAPNRPADMRSFDPELVTRLLDLVSAHFEYVVIDMPRTWFSWTDSVLTGTNRLFVVSENTVPALRQAKQLVTAIRERLNEGPKPEVIVNRFEQRMFAPGLKRNDLVQALGDAYAGAVPNDYALVREAIDRGVPLDEIKPGNRITQHLRKVILPRVAEKSSALSFPVMKKLKVAFTR